LKQVIVRSGQIVVADVPEPVLEPGTLLVSVAASCISSGTELSGIAAANVPLWRRAARNPAKVKRAVEMLGSRGLRHTMSVVREQVGGGTPLGYSAAGTVRAVAEDVVGFQPGDRVACAGAGIANHASVARVPVNLAVPVPSSVSLHQASTVALGAIALQGVRRAQLSLGETVVVIGLGALGQLTVQLLKASGCRVLVADVDPERVRHAVERGADASLGPDDARSERDVALLTAGVGADSVIITAATASNDVVARAFRSCRKKGRVVLVGDVGLDLKRSDIYAKELDFLVSTSYGPGRYDRRYEEEGLDYPIGYVRWTENRNMEEFLRLVADGRVDVGPLVGTSFPVEEAASAYAALGIDPKPLSAVLTYGQEEHRLEVRPSPAAKRRPAPRVSRGGRVRLALVGTGTFARTMHLPNLRALADLYELRWVVSRSGVTASELARQYGVPSVSTDLDEALADDGLDAVLVATNHDTHASIALRCLAAGKHVLVEKPLCLHRQDLDAVQRFFEEGQSDRPVLMTGFNRRFSSHATTVANTVGGRRAPLVISYRVNAGWLSPDSWVYGPEGGGRNLGEACHMYDLFGFFTGARLRGTQSSTTGPPPSSYHRSDNFTATVTFEDGSLATLTYTSLGPTGLPKERCEVFCDGMVAVLDDFNSTSVTGGHGTQVLASKPDKGHRAELEVFGRAVLGGGEWPIPLWQQVQATEIALQVEDSFRAAPLPGIG
jgi:predicted dehydrogenase/threonine dehydrogenase-like Zn-dependent dehydrogenase